MTEKHLIAKIKELRQIKPRKEWAVLAKERILAEKTALGDRVSQPFELIEGLRMIFSHKLAFASVLTVFVLIGVLGFAQNSLPGTPLYYLRKITERGQGIFASEEEFSLKIANNRLEDLSKIVQNNAVRNLAPAINEYQASVSEVAKKISEKTDPDRVKKIVKEVQNIEKKTEEIRSLGVEIEENIDLDIALIKLMEAQVKDLQNRTLTEEQIKSLEEIKADIEAGKYSEALEKVLLLPN